MYSEICTCAASQAFLFDLAWMLLRAMRASGLLVLQHWGWQAGLMAEEFADLQAGGKVLED